MDGLTIQRNVWYAWEVHLAERGGYPDLSPIYIYEVKPLKTGRRILNLRFFNAFYVPGVQDMDKDIQLLKHTAGYLLGEIVEEPRRDQVCLIREISYEWLRSLISSSAGYLEKNPPKPGEDVQAYLSKHLLGEG